jgi:hypothetical protein
MVVRVFDAKVVGFGLDTLGPRESIVVVDVHLS